MSWLSDLFTKSGPSGHDYYREQMDWMKKIIEPQSEYMKEVLPKVKESIFALTPVLTETITGKGLPPELQDIYQRRGWQQIFRQGKDLATKASEALAGKGRLSSGIVNAVMKSIMEKQAEAGTDLAERLVGREYENLWEAIQAVLGLASGTPMRMSYALPSYSSAVDTGTDLSGFGQMAGSALIAAALLGGGSNKNKKE